MAQVKVDGTAYEIPESFTLREMRIIERYAEGHLAGDGYEMGKMCGAIHVAILRQRPELSFEEIQEVVDNIDSESLEEQTAGGQSPPAEKKSEPPDSSGSDSEASSEPTQENGTPGTSGIPGLPTGFTSFHGTSTTSPQGS